MIVAALTVTNLFEWMGKWKKNDKYDASLVPSVSMDFNCKCLNACVLLFITSRQMRLKHSPPRNPVGKLW